MTAVAAIAAVLVSAGVAVVVVTAWRALLARDDLTRLHYVTPASSLGVPLIGIGIAFVTGWTWTTATVLLVVALLAVSAPPLGAAIARMAAAQEET